MWRFTGFTFGFTTVHVSAVSLPTEVIILIVSYLPAIEPCAFQRTYHRINYTVADSARLQYVLHAQINGVEDSHLLIAHFPNASSS